MQEFDEDVAWGLARGDLDRGVRLDSGVLASRILYVISGEGFPSICNLGRFSLYDGILNS